MAVRQVERLPADRLRRRGKTGALGNPAFGPARPPGYLEHPPVSPRLEEKRRALCPLLHRKSYLFFRFSNPSPKAHKTAPATMTPAVTPSRISKICPLCSLYQSSSKAYTTFSKSAPYSAQMSCKYGLAYVFTPALALMGSVTAFPLARSAASPRSNRASACVPSGNSMM